MIQSAIFRNWWVILIQGILMIILSLVIFNNPDTVLATMALWLGVIVAFTGLVGLVAYFFDAKESRDFSTLFGSLAIFLIGILMIAKMFVTMKAITLVFGILVTVVGLVLISVSWRERKEWSLWWLIALLGVGALIVGIKSIADFNSGAQNISTLIGISVLLSGIGLVCLSFLKRRIVVTVRNKVDAVRSELNKGARY